MPPVGVTPKTRSMMRFLSIDPEIFPLMGVLLTIFTGVGYMLGRKATNVNSEGEGETSDFKYRFHKNADLNEQILEAPSAVAEHKIRVNLPKETKERLPKGMTVE
ncbi:8877_t:CDS:2 [Ambispora leptoticha]|uniref:8877_t:CDS:1 n=1 Tax=Ambispora leptoticha TaxID=144679 RepID=A0A9N9CEL7_9GLOM|nr:8877_t:CDS:2 [Ambispora leptoticha]